MLTEKKGEVVKNGLTTLPLGAAPQPTTRNFFALFISNNVIFYHFWKHFYCFRLNQGDDLSTPAPPPPKKKKNTPKSGEICNKMKKVNFRQFFIFFGQTFNVFTFASLRLLFQGKVGTFWTFFRELRALFLIGFVKTLCVFGKKTT